MGIVAFNAFHDDCVSPVPGVLSKSTVKPLNFFEQYYRLVGFVFDGHGCELGVSVALCFRPHDVYEDKPTHLNHPLFLSQVS